MCLSHTTSCSYQLVTEDTFPKRTIYVPFAEGDYDGSLTSFVIQKLSNSGFFSYREAGAEWILKIKILDCREENIGFRYDRNNQDELIRTVIPIELRYACLTEIVVINAYTGCIEIGPVGISTHVDLDHDYTSCRDGINVVSLGQLTDIDGAKDMMHIPLNEALAQKIADYVSNSW